MHNILIAFTWAAALTVAILLFRTRSQHRAVIASILGRWIGARAWPGTRSTATLDTASTPRSPGVVSTVYYESKAVGINIATTNLLTCIGFTFPWFRSDLDQNLSGHKQGCRKSRRWREKESREKRKKKKQEKKSERFIQNN